jgi:hypothetical protein
MRKFENFPVDSICPICGTNTNQECVLIPIDGTQDGYNVQAAVVHFGCIVKSIVLMHVNLEAGVIYAPILRDSISLAKE